MSRNSPEAICERILDLSREIEPAVGLISDLKESLRKIVEDTGEALNIEIKGKGQVTVSAGAEEKFRGIVLVLDEAAFLDLPDARRERLIADQVVTMEKQFTKATRPAVTVRL